MVEEHPPTNKFLPRGSDLFSGEKSSIDGFDPLYGFYIDNDVDEGIEGVDRPPIAYFWSFDTQFFGLTVDTFTAGALAIDGLVERPRSVEGHAHLPSQLGVDIFDTATAFEKLGMVATLIGFLGDEQGAPVAQGLVAIGVSKGEGRCHPQSFGTARHPIRVTRESGMSVLIERNCRNASM